jgi:pimeloyl-ACP methyl ester carboxylesterase
MKERQTYKVNYIIGSDNIKLAYLDEGSGPHTLLFIHGLANAALVWQKNIEVLKLKYRCIALDLPGNGNSQHGNYAYGISFFAKAVYNFIQQMHLQNVILVGHSMGGQVAIATAVKYPDSCKELILCAPAGFETFTPLERTIYQSTIHFFDFFSTEENSLRKILQSSFYQFPLQANEMIEELVGFLKNYPMPEYRKMIEKCIMSMLEEPVYGDIQTLKQPAIVIYGERDALIPNKLIHHYTTRQMADKAIQLFRDATLKMIPQCGHFVHWEKAKEVNHFIEWFINRHE